ncbi:MAG: tetratricopeptide repeat protein [Opitutaceae bacterium]|nr:tetratricopeptide repeat protein [Opitutaceae bacterium]
MILFVVLIAYWPVFSAGFIWDDNAHLTRADLRSLGGLGRIWFEIGATQQYYPLLHSAFWIEHRLWGDAALGYHAINLVWHALAAWLFGLVLRRLAVPGAWFAALLFALHPVCVESVAWISEQKNTLSLTLYLAAALAYLRFDDERRPWRHALATGLFLLALLTKTVTASLPAALLVVAWWRRGRVDWRRDVVPLLPWFVLGVSGGLLTAWFEHALIGAKGEAFELGPLERLLLAGRVVWFYLGKLAWPHPLIFTYPRWEIDASSWVAWLFPASALVGLAALVMLAWRQGRRAPLAVALLFGGTLFPVLGFVNVYPFIYSLVADHFQYHASLAVFAGAAAGLTRATARLARLWVFGAAAALLVVCGVLSSRQSRTYRDLFVLYETTLARNPGSWMAHNNLGIALVKDGRASEALPHYREALRLRPGHEDIENNFGYALIELGRPAEAVPHLRRAVELRPDYRQARNNLASALLALGRGDESLEVFRETLRMFPDDGDAHFNLGLTLARLGRTIEAQSCFEAAVRIRPDDAKYVLNVGNALLFNRGLDAAMPHYRRALELDPASAMARYTVGRALAERGRYGEGAELLMRAVQLDPNFAPAYGDLAAALEAMGRFSEAERYRAEAPR